MKRYILIIFLFLLSLNIVKATPLPVDVTADSAFLFNLDKNEVVYTKNPDKVEILASLTKIMTVYTTIKNVENLDKKITITEKDLANLYGFTQAGLEEGDKVSYRDLLYAAMLISGADASQALALHVSGSMESFVELMNSEARKLGLRHTNFVDSYGADDNNVSTSREIILLLKEALQNDTFKKVFQSNYYTLSNGLRVVNYTASLATFHGLDSSILTGNKSGFTPEAGLLLASTSNVNDTNYILVVCKSDINSYKTQHVLDTYKILNYIKDIEYKERVILKKGTILKKIKASDSTISEYIITVDKDIKATLSDEDFSKIRYEYNIVNNLTPENRIGDNLGYVDIMIDDEIIETYHIYLRDDIFSYKKEPKVIVIIIVALIFFAIVMLCTNIMVLERKRI